MNANISAISSLLQYLTPQNSAQHVKEKNNFLNTVLALEYSALCKEHKNVIEDMGCIIICPVLKNRQCVIC